MNIRKINVILFSVSVIVLLGCANSTEVFRYNNNTDYSSLYVQRDAGAKVFIIMNDSEEYSGELLRVRDSTMILCKKYAASEASLSESQYPLYVIQNYNMKIMKLKGENHLIGGLVFGGLIGVTLGVFYGYGITASSDSPPFDGPLGYILIGGGTGMLIGGLIGGSNTTYDEEIYTFKNPKDVDFKQLNIYSRYGAEEPKFLKKIK